MPDIQNIPTTQYIGPRIIPHLWNPILWDEDTQYDALAVVQYNGVPYIARYVPPQGTLPTDPEYWVRWADFNAQMAQLQQTVESFDNRITANATDIDTLEAIVPRSAFSSTNTVQKAINDEATARQKAINDEATARQKAINDEVTARQKAINDEATARQKAINSTNANVAANATDIATIAERYQGGDIVIIGDSYDEAYSPDFKDGVSWSTRLQNTLSASNIKVYDSHLGGSGLAVGSRTFAQQLTNLAATMTEAQRNRISTIVFYGGYNDQNASSASITNGMEAFVKACTANFKNAHRIIGAFVGRCVTGKTTGAHASAQFSNVQGALNNWIVAAWESPRCVSIANGIQVLGSNGAFSSDFVHPSKQGLNLIASFMNSVVFGTPCANTYNGVETTHVLSTHDYTASGSIVINCEAFDPQGTQYRAINLAAIINWGTAVSHSFGPSSTFEFDLEPCSALMGADMRGTCLAVVKYNGKYYEAPAAWRIAGTKLTVKVLMTNSEHTNYLTASVQQLQLASL